MTSSPAVEWARKVAEENTKKGERSIRGRTSTAARWPKTRRVAEKAIGTVSAAATAGTHRVTWSHSPTASTAG